MGWWYYESYKPASPLKVKDGIKTKKQRGDIGEKWWSKKWIKVLESFDIGARLSRGRSYARKGQITSMELGKGTVTAKVQGTRRKPYSVKIMVDPLREDDWERVISLMASQAIFAAKLLSGEMPQNIEEAFNEASISLFPASKRDLETDCSCPDWSNPCKHIAAVYYVMADRFDEDPFMIFKLRGMTKEEIIKALREKRSVAGGEGGVSPEESSFEDIPSLEECLENFWQGGEELENFSVNLTEAGEESAILKRLGESPFTAGKENLTSILSEVYSAVSKAALEKVAGSFFKETEL